MKANRSIKNDRSGYMNMIMTAIVMAIAFAVGIIITFNIMGSLDFDTVDQNLQEGLGEGPGAWNYNKTTPSANASNDLINNLETFYTIGPIALIIVAAVGILSYILLLRRQ